MTMATHSLAALDVDTTYTRAQLAQILGVTKDTVRRWEAAGLPVSRVGKQRFYAATAVRAWLQGQMTDAA